MKRLIALLLLAPAVASAYQTLNITSGSIFFPGTCCLITQPGGTFSHVTFSFSGNGFTGTGGWTIVNAAAENPLISGLHVGSNVVGSVGFSEETLGVDLRINGVPYDPGPFGDSVAVLNSVVSINGPGLYTGPFNFDLAFHEFENCPPGTCTTLVVVGQGTYKLDVVQSPDDPASFQGIQDILTFNAPEPSTLLLSLLGVGGLVIANRRRSSPTEGAFFG
jgi:hypothetical protein